MAFLLRRFETSGQHLLSVDCQAEMIDSCCLKRSQLRRTYLCIRTRQNNQEITRESLVHSSPNTRMHNAHARAHTHTHIRARAGKRTHTQAHTHNHFIFEEAWLKMQQTEPRRQACHWTSGIPGRNQSIPNHIVQAKKKKKKKKPCKSSGLSTEENRNNFRVLGATERRWECLGGGREAGGRETGGAVLPR